jgi:Domain of unknown function (DUF4352)
VDESNRPWYKIWWIYLAIIVAVVAVAVAVLAAGPANTPSEGTPTPTSTLTPTPTPTLTPTPTPTENLFLGFDIEDYETGVTSLDQGTLHEEAMGAFTLVLLSVENSNDEPIIFDVNNVRGIDSSARTLAPDVEAAAIANMRNQGGLFLKAVQPGETITGLVVFDVPAGETLLAIVVPDGASPDGTEIPIPY